MNVNVHKGEEQLIRLAELCYTERMWIHVGEEQQIRYKRIVLYSDANVDIHIGEEQLIRYSRIGLFRNECGYTWERNS